MIPGSIYQRFSRQSKLTSYLISQHGLSSSLNAKILFVFEQPLPPALGFTAVAEAWVY